VNSQSLLSVILRGIALGMSVAAVVLGILGSAAPETQVTLLTIGLLALSLWTFQTRS
jgi:hypothetical protein